MPSMDVPDISPMYRSLNSDTRPAFGADSSVDLRQPG